MAVSAYLINDHVKEIHTKASAASEPSQTELDSPEICVICLDRISDKAAVLPCSHDQFDFLCVSIWVQQRRVCPLCKSEVIAIKHGSEKEPGKAYTIHLPEIKTSVDAGHENSRQQTSAGRYNPYSRRASILETRNRRISEPVKDAALEFRRKVYRDKIYSLRVGTNHISGYRNITPSTFSSSPRLLSRAKIFVRRELSVFDFLDTASESFGAPSRRASNTEFLLEYIMGILTSIDLRSSTGQAEELLRDFLGRDNAKLFIHELEAWLRSPYEKLADWDRHVQYRQDIDR